MQAYDSDFSVEMAVEAKARYAERIEKIRVEKFQSLYDSLCNKPYYTGSKYFVTSNLLRLVDDYIILTNFGCVIWHHCSKTCIHFALSRERRLGRHPSGFHRVDAREALATEADTVRPERVQEMAGADSRQRRAEGDVIPVTSRLGSSSIACISARVS